MKRSLSTRLQLSVWIAITIGVRQIGSGWPYIGHTSLIYFTIE